MFLSKQNSFSFKNWIIMQRSNFTRCLTKRKNAKVTEAFENMYLWLCFRVLGFVWKQRYRRELTYEGVFFVKS